MLLSNVSEYIHMFCVPMSDLHDNLHIGYNHRQCVDGSRQCTLITVIS